MAYREDFRKKVIGYLEEGHTQESAHKVFKIGLSTMKQWKKRYETTGSSAKKPIRWNFKKLDPVKLSAYVKEHPDAYLQEIGEVFGCTDAVRLALIKLGISLKKDESIQSARGAKTERVHSRGFPDTGGTNRLC